jgi:hypothetical protein
LVGVEVVVSFSAKALVLALVAVGGHSSWVLALVAVGGHSSWVLAWVRDVGEVVACEGEELLFWAVALVLALVRVGVARAPLLLGP